MPRKVIVLVAVVLSVGLAWFITRRSSPSPGAAAPRGAPEARSDDSMSRTLPRLPSLSPGAPGGAGLTVAEKRAHDQATMDAVHAFMREGMPVFDACLGPVPAPRRPQPVLVTFRRDLDSTPTSSEERFVAAEVVVLASGPSPAPAADRVVQCLERLEGRPLAIRAGGALEGTQFRQVITMFLPL